MFRTIGWRFFPAILTLLLVLSTGIASAHHGVTGRYDASRPIVLSGIVVRTIFAPPHPILAIQVDTAELPNFDVGRPNEYFAPVITRAEDLGEVRVVELSPVGTFYALNGRLDVGDRVTVLVLENCYAPHQLRSTWVRLTNGEVISYTGDWAPSVDGCN